MRRSWRLCCLCHKLSPPLWYEQRERSPEEEEGLCTVIYVASLFHHLLEMEERSRAGGLLICTSIKGKLCQSMEMYSIIFQILFLFHFPVYDDPRPTSTFLYCTVLTTSVTTATTPALMSTTGLKWNCLYDICASRSLGCDHQLVSTALSHTHTHAHAHTHTHARAHTHTSTHTHT
jgi:hypothetical protein